MFINRATLNNGIFIVSLYKPVEKLERLLMSVDFHCVQELSLCQCYFNDHRFEVLGFLITSVIQLYICFSICYLTIYVVGLSQAFEGSSILLQTLIEWLIVLIDVLVYYCGNNLLRRLNA